MSEIFHQEAFLENSADSECMKLDDSWTRWVLIVTGVYDNIDASILERVKDSSYLILDDFKRMVQLQIWLKFALLINLVY